MEYVYVVIDTRMATIVGVYRNYADAQEALNNHGHAFARITQGPVL